MKPAFLRLESAISVFTTIGWLLAAVLFLSACETEQIRKNDEILRRQEEELRQLREDKRRMEAGGRGRTESGEEDRAARQRLSCNDAFLRFEKAQAARSPEEAVALYREGLNLCPDDEVAHYELGKILADMGRLQEARREFETALQIHPGFQSARRELEQIQDR